MQYRTQNTLAELEKVDWFYAVGLQDTETALVLSTWGEAIASCASSDWQNLLLEATNRYCEHLCSRSRSRYNEWNNIVKQVKMIINPLIERKTSRIVRENKLPKIFLDTVKWDILHVAMEAEYADVYPPGFFASQAYWYVHGHFPCGWQGDFPKGKLVIY